MRSFLGFGQVPYIGQPFTNAIKLLGQSGVAVPLLFQWLSYGASTAKPNVNVLVDLTTSACKALDQIRSVYIDNLGSDNPVYILFPDTGCVLAAKPNSEGWYPAYTNAKQIWVIGEGFLTGDVPQTSVIVSNIAMAATVNTEIDNAVALWRASPVISRGNSIYNSAFGIPALGDQFFASTLLDIGNFNTVPLWNTPFASGFLYITNMLLNIVGVQETSGTRVPTLAIESTGVAGILASPSAVVFNGNTQLIQLFSMSGMQLKLDATQTWRMRVVAGVDHGSAQLFSSFTQQP